MTRDDICGMIETNRGIIETLSEQNNELEKELETLHRDFDMPKTDDVIGDEDDSFDGILKQHLKQFENDIFTLPGPGSYQITGSARFNNGYIISLPEGMVVDTETIHSLWEPESSDIPTETSCAHSWKSYTGLNEKFDYCEICDAKKNERVG